MPRRWRPDVAAVDLTARYVELVEELGKELGHEHGWRRQVAEQLGIDQPTLSKIMRGDRQVGWELAQRAAERLKLDPGYFAGSRSRARSGTAGPPTTIDELGARIRAGIASTKDVYALARAVAANPAVAQARAILKMKQPRTEQQVGALFVAASRLLDLLEEREGRSKKLG